MSLDSHKWLDIAQHLSYYISGFFTVVGIVIAFLWKDRNANKKRIVANEKQYEQLAWMMENKVATKDDLKECSKEKDDQHHEGIKDVLIKLEKNTVEHSEILEKMNDQHSETLHQMLEIHNK